MYRHAGTCYVLCLVLLICIFCNRFTAALQPDRSALGVGHLQRTATRKLLLLEQHSIEQHDGSKSGIRTLHQSVRSRAAEPARRRGTPASNSAAGPAPGLGLQCRSYLEVAANVPAVGPTDDMAESVDAGASCATRPQPLATLGGRCRIVCEKPEDLKKVVMSQIHIMSAPANYLPPNSPAAAADDGSGATAGSTTGSTVAGFAYVDPVYCQLQVTAAPLAGECQLQAYAVCCQP